MDDSLKNKEELLIACLRRLQSVIVAYSGGVDSSLLAYYARLVLGNQAKIVIAVSPSLATEELEAARQQAGLFAWDLVEISTDEVNQPDYQKNDARRCYFCKSTLFAELDKLAARESIGHVAYGANVDDQKDYRPGQIAANEHKVLSPLHQVGLSKEEIRLLARKAGLPSWDRPQAACLSSRFPLNQPITVELLSKVEQAELYLHRLGFKQVRVRHHNDTARIELAAEEITRLGSDRRLMQEVSSQIKSYGYSYVVLDLEGYRQGSTNPLSASTTAAATGKRTDG